MILGLPNGERGGANDKIRTKIGFEVVSSTMTSSRSKLTAIVFAAVVLFSFSACKKGEVEIQMEQAEETNTEDQEIQIGYAPLTEEETLADLA